jgi:uncharacterized membrane protein
MFALQCRDDFRRRASALIVLVAACGLTDAVVAAEGSDAIFVSVREIDQVVTIDVRLSVPVTPKQAFEVLTDFEHMTQIVSNLQSSTVLVQSPGRVVVEQNGRASRGPLSFSFQTVREIELSPYARIHSRMISGSLRKLEGTTLLRAEQGGTLIVNHGEFITDAWIPPVLGARFIEAETRKQFAEMRTEMLRRHRDTTSASDTEPAQSAPTQMEMTPK